MIEVTRLYVCLGVATIAIPTAIAVKLYLENVRLKGSKKAVDEKLMTLDQKVMAGEALIAALKAEYALQKERADTEFNRRVIQDGKRHEYEILARDLISLVNDLGERLEKVTKELAEAKTKAERAKILEAFFAVAKTMVAAK
jgi:hypothetical protein